MNTPNISMSETDNINSPTHYTQGNIECIDAMRAMNSFEGFLAVLTTNTLKYIWRANHKGKQLEDLKKARWYLDVAIKEIEKTKEQLENQNEAN